MKMEYEADRPVSLVTLEKLKDKARDWDWFKVDLFQDTMKERYFEWHTS